MKLINELNIDEFLNNYHNFHDGFIKSAIYDCDVDRVKIIIGINWVGEDNNKNHLVKLVFNNINSINIKELPKDNFINEIYLKYIKIKDNNYLCFADNDTNPKIYCVCEYMEFDEIK
jgi:hypothetical protein